MKIISHSANDTINIGKTIAKNLQKGDIICLFGELGSGKTVLIKGIAAGLGVRKNIVTSPSFVLIRQYTFGRIPLYHLDLYKLKELKDILALGYEEYLYDEGIAVVEWADRLKCLLPKEYLKVKLFIRGNKKRIFEFLAFGRRYKELLSKIQQDFIS